MNLNKFFKKEVTIILVSVVAVGIIIIGTTYALFNKTNSDDVSVEAGTLNLSLAFTGSSSLTTSDILPMSDSVGVTQDGHNFKVTNNGNLAAKYSIKIQNVATTNALENEYIMYSIDGGAATQLTGTGSVTISTNNTVGVDAANKQKNHNIKVWIISTAPTSIIDKNIKLQLTVDSEPTTLP